MLLSGKFVVFPLIYEQDCSVNIAEWALLYISAVGFFTLGKRVFETKSIW